MKTIYWTSLLILITCSLMATSFFSDNPAGYARRKGIELVIPVTTFQANFRNSSLSLTDLEMFQEGHVLKDSEKDKLVDADLDTDIHVSMEPLSFGYRNWQFRQQLFVTAHANILKKEFSEMVFYGNEIDSVYQVEAFKGTHALGFSKTSFAWSYPEDISLKALPNDATGLASLDGALEFLSGMSVNLGAQMNFYYGAGYGKVLNSSQEFGSLPDSNFYKVSMKYGFTDGDSDGSLVAGMGFGLRLNLPKGAFHFYMDDIMLADMRFSNLAGGLYEANYQDSLLYLQEDFEPFDESNQNDSLRISKHKVRISPTIVWGLEYNVYQKLDAMIRIQRSDYLANDGISFGVSYPLTSVIPMKLSVGFGEQTSIEYQTGLQFEHFSWDIGYIWYDGFFNGSHGLGLKSGMKLVF